MNSNNVPSVHVSAHKSRLTQKSYNYFLRWEAYVRALLGAKELPRKRQPLHKRVITTQTKGTAKNGLQQLSPRYHCICLSVLHNTSLILGWHTKHPN